MPPISIRILLIDDDEDDYLITRDLLQEVERERFNVRWIRTGTEGLEVLRREEVDLCLCDYRLGATNGLDLLRTARSEGIRIPIILLTGQGDREVDMAAMQAGASDYLVKSGLDAAQLERAIRYSLQWHRAAEALRQSELRLRQQFLRISLLNQITRAIAERQDMVSIFEVALAHLEEHLAIDLGRVFYYDSGQQSLRLVAHGPHSEVVSNQIGMSSTAIPLAMTDLQPCLNGTIVHHRDLQTEILPKARDMARFGFRSAVAVPLAVEGKTFAILSLMRRQVDAFKDDEIEFLKALSEHISMAAHHARLVTDLQQINEQLRESQQAAVRQERLAAVGQLSAGVAHEFNNILTIIQGYATMLMQAANLPPQQNEAVKNILSGAERASRLTAQLLAFSRKQVMNPEPMELNEVMGNVVKMLSRVVGENIQVRCEFTPHPIYVWADLGMLEQVIMNLSVNARDAMPKGGKLVFSTRLETLDDLVARRHPEARSGKYVCLQVTDFGLGMDEATQARLFEPFFTTKEVGKGTGLGLASIYGIVKQHQGWIEVESRVNVGTTFRIYLPEMVDHTTMATASTSFVGVPGGTETILIAEDEPALRLLVREILRSFGYQTFDANNGPEAMAVWQQHQASIDLLLTDLMMPGGMSGEELAKRLLAERPDLKVVFTSGYSVEMAGKTMANAPGNYFLPKPYRPITLARIVRDCLDGRPPSVPTDL
ncbi:MAG: response regulator [Verrucomicrobiota bacterium]